MLYLLSRSSWFRIVGKRIKKSVDKSIEKSIVGIMKRFALLWLEYNANKVIFDTKAKDASTAIAQFNKSLTGMKLDEHGYFKMGEVTFCIAEYFNAYSTHTV